VLDLARLGLALDGDRDVLDLLGGLAAPVLHGLLALLGDLLVGLTGLDGVLGRDADAAQREVLGLLAELLQVDVEGAEELVDLALQGLLCLCTALGSVLRTASMRAGASARSCSTRAGTFLACFRARSAVPAAK
jgi:hypothetical protein